MTSPRSPKSEKHTWNQNKSYYEFRQRIIGGEPREDPMRLPPDFMPLHLKMRDKFQKKEDNRSRKEHRQMLEVLKERQRRHISLEEIKGHHQRIQDYKYDRRVRKEQENYSQSSMHFIQNFRSDLAPHSSRSSAANSQSKPKIGRLE